MCLSGISIQCMKCRGNVTPFSPSDSVLYGSRCLINCFYYSMEGFMEFLVCCGCEIFFSQFFNCVSHGFFWQEDMALYFIVPLPKFYMQWLLNINFWITGESICKKRLLFRGCSDHRYCKCDHLCRMEEACSPLSLQFKKRAHLGAP